MRTARMQTALVICVLTVLTPFACNANHIVNINGSFDLGADPGNLYIAVFPGDTTIASWSVTGHGVDYVGTDWQASLDSRCIDLNDWEPGGIYQESATKSGVQITTDSATMLAFTSLNYGPCDPAPNNAQAYPVPQPSGILALMCGLAGLGGAARRGRDKQAED